MRTRGGPSLEQFMVRAIDITLPPLPTHLYQLAFWTLVPFYAYGAILVTTMRALHTALHKYSNELAMRIPHRCDSAFRNSFG